MKKNQIISWFLTFSATLITLSAFCSPTFAAQTTPFSGVALINDFNQGRIERADVISQFSEAAGIPSLDAENLVGSILDNPNISQGLGGDILTGFGRDGAGLPDISNLTQMIDGVTEQLSEFSKIKDILRETARGKISSELGLNLTQLENAEELFSAEDIGEIFENPLITDALDNLDIPNLNIEDITGQFKAVAEIFSNPQALIDAGIEQVTAEILNSVKEAAPELFAKLATAFGGEENLAASLNDLFNGGDGTDGVTPAEPNDPANCTPMCTQSCGKCAPDIHNNHVNIRTHTSAQFSYYKSWLVNSYFIENLTKALMGMTNELVTGAMQQVQIAGTFFDAKHQLETERLQQTLVARAHKDYHPSEELCAVGTNMRAFGISKRKADLAGVTIATRMNDRQSNVIDGISQEGVGTDTRARIDLFIEKFCNKTDGGSDGSDQFGLGLLCANSTPDPAQINADVNFTSTVENKLTLDIDFSTSGNASPDTENILALGANMFANDTLPIITEQQLERNPDLLNTYIDLQSKALLRSIAQHSYASIVGMRAEGDGASAPFLKAMLKDSGVNDNEITQMLGENPSYFAQEEIMTKTLYQNPDFYSNLYDKPANVERMGTALLALEIIQDRNIYDSLLRSEAVLAALVETKLLKERRRVGADLGGLKLTGRKRGN